jgi:hypothetical protein
MTRHSQVLFASGSPFDDHTHGGVTLRPAQANNAYIFPGAQPLAHCSLPAAGCSDLRSQASASAPS